MTLKVTCEAADRISIDDLVPFQGEVKSIDRDNLEKLKGRIVRHGINAPIFVWRSGRKVFKYYILDGHQRLVAMQELRDEGYDVPNVPVAFIKAKNRSDAIDKWAGITSQFGSVNIAEMQRFIAESGVDPMTLRMVDFDIELNVPDFEKMDCSEQGRLDEVGQKVKCPECGHEFYG